jgi:hypothetical protein
MHEQHPYDIPARARQHVAADNRAARRRRYIRRIGNAPDSEERWAAFLARLGQHLDIDREIDAALDAAVAADPRALALLDAVGGGR